MLVDAVQPYQIIIMVAFLLLLVGALLIARRFLGGLSKNIHRSKRMRHIEDMALTPYQRLHLVEVDGQTFMIHAGKGHAATVVVVNGKGGIVDADAPMTLMDIEKPIQKPALQKSQKVLKQRATRPANAATSPVDENHSKANVDKITSAIAEARRRNPSLGLGK